MTLGTAVAVFALLLLLVLLLWPSSADLGSGSGGSGSGSGAGSGAGASSGQGEGDGAAAGDVAGGNASQDAEAAYSGGESSAAAEATDSETDRPQQAAERSSRPPTPPEEFELGALPSTADTLENPDSTDAGRSGSGTRGSGGSQGGGGSGDSSEFFGVKSRGMRFVYIVDQSGSMTGDRFQRACSELIEAIEALSSRQAFYVYFFTDTERPMFDDSGEPKLLRATAQNKRRIRDWVTTLYASGGNGAETQSILDAVRLQPNAIYFLSDGGFDPNTANQVRDGNSDPSVPVNTIGFGDRSYEQLLQQIAEDSGGKYRFVP